MNPVGLKTDGLTLGFYGKGMEAAVSIPHIPGRIPAISEP